MKNITLNIVLQVPDSWTAEESVINKNDGEPVLILTDIVFTNVFGAGYYSIKNFKDVKIVSHDYENHRVYALVTHRHGIDMMHDEQEVFDYVESNSYDLNVEDQRTLGLLLENAQWDEAVSFYFDVHPSEYIDYIQS